MKGQVKRVLPDKGFGFIMATNGTEYFFHRSEAKDWDHINEGDRVTFEPGSGPKGPRAEAVRLVED